MMRGVSRLPTWALAVGLCGTGVALGEEGRAGQFDLDATLRNLDGGGSKLQVEGAAPSLPDGCYIHVSVTISRGPLEPAEVAFFRVPIKDRAFNGSYAWPEHRLAPAVYGVKAELFVDEQGPNIKRWLGRELGYGPEDRVELTVEQVAVGTEAEREAARVANLKVLRDFTLRAEGLRVTTGEAVNAMTSADAAWAERQQDLFDRLKTFQDDLAKFQAPWVVMEEGWLAGSIDRFIVRLTRAVQNHGRGRDGRGEVERLRSVSQRIVADINALLPPEPTEEEGEAGSDQEEGAR